MTPPTFVRRAVWVSLARGANALFFLLTATYCILTYSSFAYQQFIRPRMVASLSEFVAFHHLLHWLCLAMTVATLLPEWKQTRGRALAWTYTGAMALAGIAFVWEPILPSVENNAAGLWLACAFLVPPIWLATYDHLACAPIAMRRLDPVRFVGVAAATAVCVWGSNLASIPFRLGELGDYRTSAASLAFGALVSLVVHLGIFTVAAIVVSAIVSGIPRLRDSGRLQLTAFTIVCGAAAVLTIKTLVFGSLSFTGADAWLVAVECGIACTMTWSAIARRLTTTIAAAPSDRDHPPDALDVWLAAIPARSRMLATIGLLLLPISGVRLLPRIETFDWNFLVQHLATLASWALAFACVHTLVRRRPAATNARPVVLAAAAVLATAGVGASGTIETNVPGSSTFVTEFVLDGYATIDPSYRLLRRLLTEEPAGAREFFSYLASHSLIQHVDVKPVDITFADSLTPATTPPPHIFLFVIDSLRRDYLSPYNPRVTFTPAIDRFARESFTFQRSFTRYGGTGLSMPAIWSGSMLLHKEYVLPFQPMNALEKLLTANRYRAVMSMDHITAQLVSSDLPIVELDKGRPEMQYDFCATLGELTKKLEVGLASDRQPIFAHTRSLNLHISKLTQPQRVGAPNPAYGGFQAPAAAAVERMDTCFGTFVDALKTTGLYDDSIVIVTSDHGDALGEARRWGHAYTLFPEIVRTPLVIHVPSRLRAQFVADVEAPSYSTDITPSLYALLGYPEGRHEWPLGQSLFVTPPALGVPSADRDRHRDERQRQRNGPQIIASSYGPVYGVVEDEGRMLYIADGVNQRDYAYDISGLEPVRLGVTPDMRARDRAVIRDRIATLAALYHFIPSN